GFHEFAEFTTEDIGTSESGLNSVVLANNGRCRNIAPIFHLAVGDRPTLFLEIIIQGVGCMHGEG
ncbi:hypothetical protein CCACVL1_02160, partial [Corchorus capsularis]